MTELAAQEVAHLERAVALARAARDRGDHPFGAVVVAANGTPARTPPRSTSRPARSTRERRIPSRSSAPSPSLPPSPSTRASGPSAFTAFLASRVPTDPARRHTGSETTVQSPGSEPGTRTVGMPSERQSATTAGLSSIASTGS